MANEIGPIRYVTGLTLYVQIFNIDAGSNLNRVRDVSANAWDVFTTADWVDYDVALTEDSTSGMYFANAPTGIGTDEVFVIVYIQSGGTAAATDVDIAQGVLERS